MKQKLLGILLCLLAVLGISTAVAFADDGYTYDSTNGKLTINTEAGLTAWSTDGTINAENVTNLVIGSGVGEDKITEDTFSQCVNIENIVFEGDITLTDSFGDCNKLTSVTFKGAATLTDSFGDCNKLTSVTFKSTANLTNSFGCVYNNKAQLTTVTFESTSTIAGDSFMDCLNLTTLTFEGATTLEDRAFYISSYGNSLLKKLTFPVGSNLKYDNAFGGGMYTGLETVTFEGDIELGESAFGGCSALKTLTFEGTSTLGEQAFQNCENISSLTFKGATAIGDDAFCWNDIIASLILPAGSKVGNEAFHGWKKLETVTFAGDITLGKEIFENCPALENFFFNAEAPLNQNTFSIGTFSCLEPTDITIYVPEGAQAVYKEALENGTDPDSPNTSNSQFASCVQGHSHTWSSSKCTGCNIVCEHPNFNGYKCSVCDYVKPGGSGSSSSGGSGSSHGSSSSVQKPTVTTPENGAVTLSPDGKTATITPNDGYEIASVKVNGEEKGAITEITGLKTGDKVEVTFSKTQATLNKEAKEIASKLAPLSARSSKTAKGSVKVVVKLSTDAKAATTELKNLGYTVKYRFYRSTKKASSYKSMLEKSSTTYTNTSGKSGTRYYYKVQLRVYGKDGNLVAKTELKNCKYATSIFG